MSALPLIAGLVAAVPLPPANPPSPPYPPGLTSTAAVQLVSSLEACLGVPLPPTLAFDYPSAQDYVSSLRPTTTQQQQQPRPAAHAPTLAASDVSARMSAALAEVLGQPAAAAIGPLEPLMTSGLTSTSAVQLTAALEAR